MAQPPSRLIFGTHNIAQLPEDDAAKLFEILKAHGVTELDTARRYVDSEITLSRTIDVKDFTIHTKAAAFQPHSLSRDGVLASMEESLQALGIPSVDVYFLHSPDQATPIEETVSTIDQLYKQRKFKRFGLSNFTPAQTEEVHKVASSNGWVLPTVYQGNYNAFARHIEEDLFPVLRKLGIAFFAYSPLAGGFFAKDPDALLTGSEIGRFAKESAIGKMYNGLYNKPTLVSALKEWGNISKAAGTTKTELACRWITYHSALEHSKGDGVIIGASRPSQLEETLVTVEKGPLALDIVERIDQLWKSVKDEAPIDNYQSYSILQPRT
jgi:aflatoxin B1 aldehyde reductase